MNHTQMKQAGTGRKHILKMIIRTGFVTAALAALSACSGTSIVNGLTPSWGYTLTRDVEYGYKDRQKLDVYVPDNKAESAPVVVYFYGGRWAEGSKDQYKFLAQALTSRGYVAVIADYRLYPQVKFPAFVKDGAQAIEWVHKHAQEYGADPQKLFVMGHSAGAHIAAMLALNNEYLSNVGGSREWLAGMIGLAGPYDFLPLEAADLKDMFGPPDRYPLSQPINYVDGNNPPLLLLHGLGDDTVYPKNTRNLAKKIADRDGPVAIKLYPEIGHIKLVANLAAPLRFMGDQLDDIANFIDDVANKSAP